MTIDISNNDPRISYSVASGVTQTSFAIPFEFFDDSDVNVYVDGTLKTITTDYTISGGGGSTGTVNISVTGASGGSTVVLTRDVTIERTTDFTAGADINRAALNTQLDTLTAIAADVRDQANRALKVSDLEIAPNLTIPSIDDRKGKYLAFNSTTGAVEAGPNSADVTTLASVTSDIARLADIEDGTLDTNAIQNVSTIQSDVSTVSGISANVTTVAGNTTNVNTVAADLSGADNIGTVAASIADVNRYAEEYKISATAPSTPSAGDLWYDTTNDAFKYYDGTAWEDYAGNAAASASAAATSETNAAASETAAGASETAAATSATNAASSASSAASSASAAATSETNAASSASSASTSATNASTSATNAAASAANAASSETNAAASAASASNSASSASTSATSASASQTAAATSETNAATSASNAATSETNAATSASNAATSESNAATSASSASTSASNAASSATAAASAQTAAETARDQTLAAYDNFDDRYLGPKASDPTLDNDGNALVGGALYFNTTDGVMKVYTGTTWVAAYASLSGALLVANNLSDVASVSAAQTNLGLGTTNTPTFAGGTFTGNVSFGDNDKAIFGAGSDLQIFHDGSHSYIQDAGTGNLDLRTNGARVYIGSVSGETSGRFDTDGSVYLYDDNALKFRTTATGVDVTGTVTADGLTVDGVIQTVGGGSAGAVAIGVGDTDSGLFRSAFNEVRIAAGGKNVAGFFNSADVAFYEDTGTTPKFFWDASTQRLGIGTTSPAQLLELAGSTPSIRLNDNRLIAWTGGEDLGGVDFYTSDNSANGPLLGARISSVNSINSTLPDFNLAFSTAPHNDNTGPVERMRITSSGNVGIGTSSPTEDLHIKGKDGAHADVIIQAYVGYNSGLQFHDNAGMAGRIVYNHSNNYMDFYTNASERARIDASGNLLVGRSTFNNGQAGIDLAADGFLQPIRSSNIAARFVRLTSDGDIVQFRKDGTTVGNIGALSSDLYINTGDTGLRFNDGNDQIWPVSASGTSRDAAISLGNSGVRFKDLYLSGSISDGTNSKSVADIIAGGGGKVLQVVHSSVSTQASTTSTSLVDTGLSASITPTSATSKILVLFNITVWYKTLTANFDAEIALLRNSTIINYDYVEGYYASSSTSQLRETRHHGKSYLDSPNTTSSVTYKVQGRRPGQTGGEARFHFNGSMSNITLMEIAQ